MTLIDCLDSMRGCGVTIKRSGGGLVIQSATFTPSPTQKATLSTFKPLLLGIHADGAGYPVEVILDAVEAYLERVAIAGEDVDVIIAESIARDQALRALVGKLVSPYPFREGRSRQWERYMGRPCS